MNFLENESCPIPENRTMNVTVSIGVAAESEILNGLDLDALLRNADFAMYQAKSQGRNRLILYT